jgi:adenylyltransferase/sulfurtransferase
MDRYSRQVLLSQIGEEGQSRLLQSHVTIFGCGALGTCISEHLTRAGIGDILIVDRDFIELNNLQRQHLFSEDDVGEPKALVAEKKLHSINSSVSIEGIVDDVNETNIHKYGKERDILLDATDNLNARFLINDASVKWNIPWIHGACVSVHGQVMGISPQGPCLRCFLPHIPAPHTIPSVDTIGIVNTIPTVIGALESTKAIQYLVNGHMESELLIVDLWESDFRKITVNRRKECPCCVLHTFEFLERSRKSATAMVGRNAVQVNPISDCSVDLHALASRLQSAGEITLTPHVLFFSTGTISMGIFPDGRALIKGTNDEKEAQSLYTKYVGCLEKKGC